MPRVRQPQHQIRLKTQLRLKTQSRLQAMPRQTRPACAPPCGSTSASSRPCCTASAASSAPCLSAAASCPPAPSTLMWPWSATASCAASASPPGDFSAATPSPVAALTPFPQDATHHRALRIQPLPTLPRAENKAVSHPMHRGAPAIGCPHTSGAPAHAPGAPFMRSPIAHGWGERRGARSSRQPYRRRAGCILSTALYASSAYAVILIEVVPIRTSCIPHLFLMEYAESVHLESNSGGFK